MNKFGLTKCEAAFLAVLLYSEKDNLKPLGKDLLSRFISFSHNDFVSMIATILASEE